MTRRDKRKIHMTIIAILAVGVFGSSAWLVIYDVRSGRNAAPQETTDSLPPGLSARDLESDVNRTRRNIEPEGFLGSSLARFHLRAGRYPNRLRDLLERPADLDPAIHWDGPYVSTPELLNDAWDHPYEYVYPGVRNPTGYDLWSRGPDGISDTLDDISNW